MARVTIWLLDGTNEIPAMVRPDDTSDRAWADAFYEQIVSRCQNELRSVPEPAHCLPRATKLWSLARLLAGHHGVDAGTMPVMPPVASAADFRGAVESLSRWGQQQGKAQRATPNHARDQFAYGKMKQGHSLSALRKLVEKRKKFFAFNSDQAVSLAAKRWAIRNGQPWPL